jgi:hypothetical protein
MVRHMALRSLGVRAIGVLALFGTVFMGLPTATEATITPCSNPPAVFPEAKLEAGTVGTGWTAVKGRTPEPFQVEVLGVLKDGIWPGLDFILVQVSGSTVDEFGGIAAGMSGSPVYINGKLAGAISYGFYASDHTIGGMTPAQPMVDIFNYPARPGGSTTRMSAKVSMPPRLRQAAATATSATATDYGTAKRLPLPLSVSGASSDDLNRVTRRFDKRGVSVIPYIGGSARATTASKPSPIQPGEPVSATLSYGAITYAAVGTATAVCGDYVVAFGHEFFLSGGGAAEGMNAADVLTVVSDPSGIYGPWKLAQVAEPHGYIDQDVEAGIRGVEGRLPAFVVPIHSDYTSLDTGQEVKGHTTVAARGYWLRGIAADHVYYELRAVLNDYNGSINAKWTITGTADGQPFAVSHANVFSGNYVRSRAANEVYDAIRALQTQNFARVKFDSVRSTGTVTQAINAAHVKRALVASSVQPTFDTRTDLKVTSTDTIKVRVPIVPKGATKAEIVTFSIPVPAGATGGGRLEIQSPASQNLYRLKATSFKSLLNKLETLGRGDQLTATLTMKGAKPVHMIVQADHVLDNSRTRVDVHLVS